MSDDDTNATWFSVLPDHSGGTYQFYVSGPWSELPEERITPKDSRVMYRTVGAALEEVMRLNGLLGKKREADSDIDMFEMDEEGNPELDSRYGTNDDPRIPKE